MFGSCEELSQAYTHIMYIEVKLSIIRSAKEWRASNATSQHPNIPAYYGDVLALPRNRIIGELWRIVLSEGRITY
mgnify:CR=1 FL=1